MKLKWILAALLVTMVTFGTGVFAQGDPIRTITLTTRPQAAQPQEFQAAQLIAQAWRQLGLEVEVERDALGADGRPRLVRPPHLGHDHVADGGPPRAQRPRRDCL